MHLMQGKRWVGRMVRVKEKKARGTGFAERVEGTGVVARAGQEGDKKPRPNRVPTGSRKAIGGSGGLGLMYREAAKQVRVCGGINARDLYCSGTEQTGDTENGDVDAHSTHSLYPYPLRCAGGVRWRNGFEGNAVFEGEK